MSAFKFKYFTKIELVHSVGEGLKFARVQHRQSGAETTEVEARIATYFWFVLLWIINGRLLTCSANLIWTVVMLGC